MTDPLGASVHDRCEAESATPLVIVVMGVSASGKTSVARALADALKVPWRDADNLHPEANVMKMAEGIPLHDADRWPWLDAVGAELTAAALDSGVVMACSALRRAYRDRLRRAHPNILFVHLHGEPNVLMKRATFREDHFMPAALLQSQYATLEQLADDETGVVIDVAPSIDGVSGAALDWIKNHVR